MTALAQSTKRKLSLLQLAEELGNVSKACKIMGYHRDTFYKVRRVFQVGGVQALVDERRGPKNPHPNRVAPELEAQILFLQRYNFQRTHQGYRLAGRTPARALADALGLDPIPFPHPEISNSEDQNQAA